jgi:octaprenyl-diphosphate synthase
MQLADVQALVEADMQAVNTLIQKRLQSEVVLVNQLGAYIINSGGKRLRPLLHLLCAGAMGAEGWHKHQVAAIIEFIHTATLLHDDVVDSSDMRRGQETANALFGNEASVLVGDFLYSRAFEMMVEIDNMRVMSILARATNVIAEGEVMQLLNVHDADTTEERYLEVIRCKTAKLFEAAAQLAAVITGAPQEQENALSAYGMYLGKSFQLIDDVLDYSASSEELGKNVGDDLAEGKPTLPLIYAMRKGSPAQAKVVREAIEKGGLEQIDAVLEAIESTGAIDYTARTAEQAANTAVEAIKGLPDSDYRQALEALARFSVERSY